MVKKALSALLLVLSACVAEPPERSSLPPVDEVLPQPTGCLLSVGGPLGVGVTEVIPGSAADGTLQVDDLIIGVDGKPTLTSTSLIEEVGAGNVGDSIELTLVRSGSSVGVDVVLQANPEDASRPRLGVMIRTAYETVLVNDADNVIEPSQTARPLAIGDDIVLFDPVAHTWLHTEMSVAPKVGWTSTTQAVYSISNDEDAVITDLTADEAIAHDGIREWSPRRLIGSLGPNLILMVTAAIPDQPDFVNVAVALLDPALGETKWVTPMVTEFGVPVAAYGAPDGSGFVLVGADQDTNEITGIVFYEGTGMARSNPELIDLGTPVGWFDATRLAFRSSDEVISVYSFIDGSTETFEVPDALLSAPVAAVGDGRQIMAVAGRDLVLDDLTADTELLTLASNCQVGRIGEPGWGT